MGQVGKPRIDRLPVGVGLHIESLQRLHLLAQDCRRRVDDGSHFGAAPRLGLTRREADAGNGGKPFFKLAVEAVGAMTDEEFQQPDDKRTGEAEQRRGKRRTHPPKLTLQALHQFVEYLNARLALLRGERADSVDHCGNGSGETVERAEQSQEDQQIAHVPRDVALLIDPGCNRVEDRAGIRRRNLHSCAARAQQRRERRQQPRRFDHVVPGPMLDEIVDPADRLHKLQHVQEADDDAEGENHADKTVQQRLGEENTPQHRECHDKPCGDRHGDDDHQDDLAHGLVETRRGSGGLHKAPDPVCRT